MATITSTTTLLLPPPLSPANSIPSVSLPLNLQYPSQVLLFLVCDLWSLWTFCALWIGLTLNPSGLCWKRLHLYWIIWDFGFWVVLVSNFWLLYCVLHEIGALGMWRRCLFLGVCGCNVKNCICNAHFPFLCSKDYVVHVWCNLCNSRVNGSSCRRFWSVVPRGTNMLTNYQFNGGMYCKYSRYG